ncbi:MAG: type VII secretion integral membrane protein EccD [Mycolicibacterium cosmeticum]|nr:type VII secretion integral membrane protein EccD [Mycolicibacterium cosmeticum]
MEDSLCRVSVAWSGVLVDVALPRGLPLAALLPDLVDLVVGHDVRADVTRTWHLRRPLGEWLDAAMTLRECGVHDGDVLTMSGAPVPTFARTAPGQFRTVDLAQAPRPTARVSEAWAWCAAVAVATLMAPLAMDGNPVVSAAIGAATVAIAAVVARRAPGARMASCVVAVIFSAATGYLVIGTSPQAANVLLGSAAAAVSSIALLRLTRSGTTLLTACATFAALVAVAVTPAVVTPVGMLVVAAILTLAALSTLGTAARLVIMLTGLTPTLTGHTESAVTDRRAVHARAVLAGVVSGSAAAAATGAAVLAVGYAEAGSVPAAGPVLPAVVAGVLFLRSRLFADGDCRIAVVSGGLVCATATSVILLLSVPAHAGWLAVTSVGVAGSLYAQRHSVSPSWARSVDVLEGALLVSVIPLAGWTSGLLGVARNMNMPW